MIRSTVIGVAVLLCASVLGIGQPLTKPFPFAFDDSVKINETLARTTVIPAGSKGRVALTDDGHLGFTDGSKLRIDRKSTRLNSSH